MFVGFASCSAFSAVGGNVTGMMMLRNVNGVAAPQQAICCNLCHSNSSPSTSVSNIQCRSSQVGALGARLQALKCKDRMVKPLALKDMCHTPFLIGQQPFRLALLNASAFEKPLVRLRIGVNAIDAGQSGADSYPQESSIPVKEEGISSEKAVDKNSSVSGVNFDFSNAQEASEEAARKALGILRETTDQLREQAEKARSVLTASAQELPIRGKENLSYVAENGPDPVKDIAETALNAHYPQNGSAKKGAKIHDFCLGIPYGALLVVGGLVGFIITGSTDSIRFGVLLGGLLLALTITSLKTWKRGESSLPYIQGQAVITGALLFRFLRRYGETKSVFPTGVIALISAAMLAFYVYVFLSGGNPPKKIASEGSY